MSFWTRVAEWTGLNYRAEETTDTGILPPPRTDSYTVTTDAAMGLASVYRAVQILATAGSQLSLTSERQGEAVPADQVPSLVKRPNLSMSRSDFVEQFLISMATNGNAYWHLKRTSAAGEILEIEPWNPVEVRPEVDARTGRLHYWRNGKKYPATDVKHIQLMKLPGRLIGLGPIQAARTELRGAIELRDYASLWFSESKIPSGILKSDQALNKEDAKLAREAWNGTDIAPIDNPSGVRVLGKGLDYKPLMINPEDAQWIESRKFSTTEIARLFGVPASLMLAGVEGNSMTYSNVEQDWLAFTRFTLMGYLRKFEEALTDLTPRGQSVRFNVETLLRTDTKSRYEAHGMALGRWLTVDEVRSIENLPALTPEQRAQLDATPTKTPQTEDAK
jgi:HK97 family phage portal protein